MLGKVRSYFFLEESLKKLHIVCGQITNLVSRITFSQTFTVLLLSIANKVLEERVQEMNGNTDKTVAELKERIQSLEKELDNANELLSSSKLRGQLV